MELSKTWSTSLQISLYLLTLVTVSQSEPQFITQPTERTVLEGADVTLYCVIDNLLPSHEVLWYRGDIHISTGTIIDPSLTQIADHFSIEGNEDMGEYNLKITEVTLADDVLYRCEVTQTSSAFILESDNARLEVHHVPPNKYPSCFPLSKESFVAGEMITLTCESERGNPPVMLSWLRKEENLPVHYDDTQSGYRSIDYELTVGPENHGDIFQCKLKSSANTAVRRSCSLGPIIVLFPPAKPTLEMTPKVIITDQEIEISCETDANPTPQYVWTFSNNFDQSRITYSENGKSILFTTELSDNGTVITCNTTNDYGSDQSQVLLNFNPLQTNPVYGTTPSQTLKPNDGNEDLPNKPPQTDTSNNVILKPEVLAIVASTLTLILLVLIILIVITCRCRPQNPKTVNQMPQMIYGQYGPNSIQGWEQGSIYFEPRDRISVRDMPTMQRPTPWHRNVAVQVPWVEEPPYEEIGQNWDEGMTLEI